MPGDLGAGGRLSPAYPQAGENMTETFLQAYRENGEGSAHEGYARGPERPTRL